MDDRTHPPDLGRRIEALFDELSAHPPRERGRLLARAGRDDSAAAREVRELLASAARSGSFLDAPAFARPGIPFPGSDRAVGESVGPYRLLSVLGRGGMGTVFAAVREHPSREVALKVLNDARFAGADDLARFEREAESLGRLQHPGIATLYEAGPAEDGVPYIAMELVRGPTLDEFVADRDPGRETRLDLVEQVCEAVAYAHRCGVVHRDLKPRNVVVLERPDGPRVKVLDFGLARFTTAEPASSDAVSYTHLTLPTIYSV